MIGLQNCKAEIAENFYPVPKSGKSTVSVSFFFFFFFFSSFFVRNLLLADISEDQLMFNVVSFSLAFSFF